MAAALWNRCNATVPPHHNYDLVGSHRLNSSSSSPLPIRDRCYAQSASLLRSILFFFATVLLFCLIWLTLSWLSVPFRQDGRIDGWSANDDRSTPIRDWTARVGDATPMNTLDAKVDDNDKSSRKTMRHMQTTIDVAVKPPLQPISKALLSPSSASSPIHSLLRPVASRLVASSLAPLVLPPRIPLLITLAPFAPFRLPGFVVVTYASAFYFNRLLNLIGSIHYFEHGQRILVYDLGLTLPQKARLECIAFVSLRTLDFDALPAHVGNLFNYAWKIFVLDALSREVGVESFLVLDSGIELSKPNSLSPAKVELQERGFWGITQSNEVLLKSSPATLRMLGVDLELLKGKTFCAGGVIGFSVSSEAYKRIVPRALGCAMDAECISPRDAGRSTHNYDQSVLSALIYSNGLSCEPAREIREYDMSMLVLDPARYNANVLSLRRWNLPKVYANGYYIEQNVTDGLEQGRDVTNPAPEQCRFQTDAELDAYSSAKHIEQHVSLRLAAWIAGNMSRALLLEQTDGSYMEENSPLLLCLHAHRNARAPCLPLIRAHFHRMVSNQAQPVKALIMAAVNPWIHRLIRMEGATMSVIIAMLSAALAVAWMMGKIPIRDIIATARGTKEEKRRGGEMTSVTHRGSGFGISRSPSTSLLQSSSSSSPHLPSSSSSSSLTLPTSTTPSLASRSAAPLLRSRSNSFSGSDASPGDILSDHNHHSHRGSSGGGGGGDHGHRSASAEREVQNRLAQQHQHDSDHQPEDHHDHHEHQYRSATSTTSTSSNKASSSTHTRSITISVIIIACILILYSSYHNIFGNSSGRHTR